MKALLIGVAAALATGSAAPARGQVPIHFSGAAGVSAPVGDLGDASNVGFNLNVRGEAGMERTWGWRGDISWDRFGGRGTVDNWTYLGFAGNVLHRQAGPLYQYAGLGIYNEREGFHRPFVDVDQTNVGVQAGVGYNFSRSNRSNTFIEIGVVNVFTSGVNSVWFPLRFGVRF